MAAGDSGVHILHRKSKEEEACGSFKSKERKLLEERNMCYGK